MKQKKGLLTVIIIAVLVAVIILVTRDTKSNDQREVESQETEVKITPLVIETHQEDQVGKVSIYESGELVYQYEGPIKVNKSNGEYEIRIETYRCSCIEQSTGEMEE